MRSGRLAQRRQSASARAKNRPGELSNARAGRSRARLLSVVEGHDIERLWSCGLGTCRHTGPIRDPAQDHPKAPQVQSRFPARRACGGSQTTARRELPCAGEEDQLEAHYFGWVREPRPRAAECSFQASCEAARDTLRQSSHLTDRP